MNEKTVHAQFVRTEGAYFPHLAAKGFPLALSVSRLAAPQAEAALRQMLVDALDELKGPDQRWSFSTIGPMQEKKNLGVINFLAVHQFETTVRMSEMLKESEEQAFTTCEIVFTASNALIRELFLSSRLDLGWDLQFRGWLLNEGDRPDLNLAYKQITEGRFTIPINGVRVAFATSDDWDTIEFISNDRVLLTRIQSMVKETKVGR
jgi:hypothetical protein